MSTKQELFDWEEIDRKSVSELWTVDEIFNDATTEMLSTTFREDHRIERKPPGIHWDSVATYICMWANTPPDGGIMVFGVEDDGSISGCTRKSEHLIEVERRVRFDLVQDARLDVKRIPTRTSINEADYLVLFRIKYREDKVVETNKGEAFIRWASSRHMLTRDERRELEIERGQVSFELESCTLKFDDDNFDMHAIRSWSDNVRKIKNMQTDVPAHQMLCAHKLGKMVQGAFAPNNACALLFGRQPQDVVPGCMVRFQRIEGVYAATGKDRNVVRDTAITGTVPQIISQTAAAIEAQIRTYSRLGNDGKFYTAPEYPFEAWYEVVVNACAHRSYSLRGMNIFVRMYDDKLVIDSPGGFPPNVTPQNIYEVHHRRNWWLMDAMFYMDLVKCENEGTKRIRDAMLSLSLPAPQFDQKQVGSTVVSVTLRNNHNVRERWVDSDVSEIVGNIVASQMSDIEKRVVNFVAEHGRVNVSEAMRLEPVPQWHRARKLLDGLVTKGVLQRFCKFERDPNTHYKLINPSAPTKPSEAT